MTQRPGRPHGHTPDGQKIRSLRVSLGLSAAQLGYQVGRDPESVRRAERGGRISDVFAVRLAKALGVKVEDIATPPGKVAA